MRRMYLDKSCHGASGCRGGVANADDSEYELEIAQGCNASPAMMAFAAHIDEITELLYLLLSRRDSALASMILSSMHTAEDALERLMQERAASAAEESA